MAVTALGKTYARLVYNGRRVYPDDVPAGIRQDVADSYIEMYGEPIPVTKEV